jgi:outer membrane lipoprotein-sorting protein
MSFLRTISTRRLLGLTAGIVTVAAGGTIALASSSGGPLPPPERLAVAIHQALGAPAVRSMTARIRFTNHLIDSASIEGSDPILTGASGRLWVSDNHLRLELQSDQGDAQVVLNGKDFWVYDGGSDTLYRGRIPQPQGGDTSTREHHGVPSVAQIQKEIERLLQHASLSGAVPGDVAGRPAYTVRISPKHDDGLLGAAELAWDSLRGVPLRMAVYSRGSGSPVLELRATDISYGPVPPSAFHVSPPKSAEVVDVSPPSGRERGARSHAERRPATSRGAVARALPFRLSAPAALVGLPRHEVRLLDWNSSLAALVTYGRNLGGIAVIERRVPDGQRHPGGGQAGSGERRPGRLTLPKVSINGATGEELDSALGTMVRFERGHVAYMVIGSVPPAAAEAAARGL